ncbi:MAG: aminotransferase class III-fold pyridoxal phosphate-dependent enzyme [Chloroflexota bacterium]|nr:aminotransferase class III-fold pyridoxal phosphate-dependent enzyme [Chloroflexota bacterium]
MSDYVHPHGHVFYRRMGHHHPLILRGEGIYLYDSEGKRYIDGSGGAIVANIGHGVESVAQAMAEQASQAAYIHATMFTSEAIEKYSAALAKIVPVPEARFYFLSSGSEVIEAAIKLARQIQYERGKTSRYLPISRWQSYHGLSMGALAVAGKPKMRSLFRPMFVDFPHIPPPYCYRCPYGLEHPQCDLRCATALEDEIKIQGTETISAFVAEPISGATLGAVVPPPGYWPRIREICDEYEILLIADEVMTGMGRTGKWFAMEHWDVEPDILTMGKGAVGGYFPLGIVAIRGDLVDLIAAGTGDFVHGGTYSHHAVGAAAGLAALQHIQRNELVQNMPQKERSLERALNTHLGDLECVGDIRGKGLMWGVELVANRDTKEAFDPKIHFAQQVADEAFRRGLILYPGSGCVDGIAGDLIMIGPPFSIGDDEIDEMILIFKNSILHVCGP